MDGSLRALEMTFDERAGVGRFRAFLSHAAPRIALAFAYGAVAGAALFLATALGPAGLREALLEPVNVRESFARLAAAAATAGSIAVSVTTLSLSRELRGVSEFADRAEANLDLRERLRAAAGKDIPLEIRESLSIALGNVADAARRVPREGAQPVRGLSLAETLDAVATTAERAADRVRTARDPTRAFVASLDFHHDLARHLARAFARSPEATPERRDALATLVTRIDEVLVLTQYLKTLVVQWGLSRMAASIAASLLPAFLASVAVVHAYGRGLPDTLGAIGASAVLAVTLVVALLPLTLFVSFIGRYLLLNRLTLPTAGFVLGPESTVGGGSEGR